MAGGQGGGTGQMGQPGAAGGAGGTGYKGDPGQSGGYEADFGGGAGGGGGGAGGGIGVSGGAGGNGGGKGGGAGGVGGTLSSPNGGAGTDGTGTSGGGGGGGGGYIGYIGPGTGALALTNLTFTGGTGGSGAPGSGGAGGGGGAGGYGAVVTGTAVPVATSVQGGAGGLGGGGGSLPGNGGDGGAGLLSVAASATIRNAGTGKIAGGAGGTFHGNSPGYVSGGAGGAGLIARGPAAIVSNLGSISGGKGGFGIANTGGAGGIGIAVVGTGGHVSNAGTVTGGAGGAGDGGMAGPGLGGGAGGAGVEFAAGGASLTNRTSGVITGGSGGYGGLKPSAAAGAGVVFDAGGMLTNAGTIAAGASARVGPGAAGVIGANLTIVDTGTIAGTKGADAIAFTGGANKLSLGAKAAASGFTGAIDIQSGTLTFDQSLGNNPANVTLTARIVGGGAIVKDGAGTLTLSGRNTYAGGTTIANGILDLKTVGSAGIGAITFASGGSAAGLTLGRAAQPGNGQSFAYTLANFGIGHALDLRGLAAGASTTSSPTAFYDPATGKLLVTENGRTEEFSMTGVAAGQSFVAMNVGNDTIIHTVAGAIACFVTGTRIRTARGQEIVDVAVEALLVGDLAVTASGAPRPIRWIGQRTIDCAAHPVPSEVWPVRVLAGAFGADLPERDLNLSPGHPVLVGSGANDVLVPIMCLINGTSIARAPVAEVTYWHVELDAHDILLAEGLPAESFLDYGNRAWFADGANQALLHPDFVAPGLAGRCRPVAIDGPQVEAERRRLDMLFALRLAGQCAWPSFEPMDDRPWM